MGLRSAHHRAGQPGERGVRPERTALVCPACPASGLPAELRGGLTFADGAFYSATATTSDRAWALRTQSTQKLVMRGGYGLTYLDCATDRGTVDRLHAGRRRTSPRSTATARRRTGWPTRIRAACSSPPDPAPGSSTALGTNIDYHIRDREIPGVPPVVGRRCSSELPWRSMLDVRLHRQRDAQHRRQPPDQRSDAASRSCSATRT